MPVDKPRKYQIIFHCNRLPALILCFKIGTRAYRDNRVAPHHYCAVVVHVTLLVHGDNHAGNDRIGALFDRLPVRLSVEKNREESKNRANYPTTSIYHVALCLHLTSVA